MTLDQQKKTHQTHKARAMSLVIIIILSRARLTIMICDSKKKKNTTKAGVKEVQNFFFLFAKFKTSNRSISLRVSIRGGKFYPYPWTYPLPTLFG